MRKSIGGFYDMGRIEIPPMPVGIVLTDRGTGTRYLLTHNRDVESPDGQGFFGITDTWPRNMNVRIFEAFDEPYISSDAKARILIRNGRLGYECNPLPQGTSDRDTQLLVSRRAGDREIVNVLTFPTIELPYRPVLGWEPMEI